MQFSPGTIAEPSLSLGRDAPLCRLAAKPHDRGADQSKAQYECEWSESTAERIQIGSEDRRKYESEEEEYEFAGK